MKKLYQIIEKTENTHHAGSKAVIDVANILKQSGFKEVVIRQMNGKGIVGKLKRQMIFLWDFLSAYKEIEEEAIVVLQHPFHHKQITRFNSLKKLKANKKVHFISLVHDIEELRQSLFDEYHANEFKEMLSLADVIIVHNDIMKQFIVNKGFDAQRVIVLSIFDYLHDLFTTNKRITFSKSLTIAGNLDINKSPYISELVKLNNLAVDLYGPNFPKETQVNDKVVYHGSFPPEEVPNYLSKGFGLVWDGSSIDTCQDNTGNYLRFNSPHKLSLYLSSGIPVIIWNQAAAADFVIQNKVGIAVSSLNEVDKILESLTLEAYEQLVTNVQKVAIQLTSGYFTKQAICKAINLV